MSVEPAYRLARSCVICGAPALFVNFGVPSCSSCKMFFKRNAEQPTKFTCEFAKHCEVNICTRRICSACRLAKCFAMGMQIELIRGRRSRKNHKRTSKAPPQFSTLNLLQSDQSTFTASQWRLLSNLIHCYDQHNNLLMAEHFIAEQSGLPLKLRYRLEPVGEFITANISRIQRVFETNRDFLSLPERDRSILLRRTVKHLGCFAGTFVLHQSRILDDPLFYTSTETIYTPTVMSTIKPITNSYDSDATFNKLVLAILAFSTANYVNMNERCSKNFADLKSILHVLDSYTEIAWKYLLYKYTHEQAIRRFSQMVRCLFRVHDTIVTVDRIQEYTQMIDSIVQKTEELLIPEK